jgi:uncharacterized protein (DUF952 family)
MIDRPPERRTILHIALPADWAAATEAGTYTVSSRGVSLEDEGFIHCSRPHQVEAVANRYYADLDQLSLLVVDAGALSSDVVDEPPFPGADEHFPHVYGPIDVDAVVGVIEWRRHNNDPWSLPGGRAAWDQPR